MLWLAFKTKTIMWDRNIVITSANLPTHRSLRRQTICQTSPHMAQRGMLEFVRRTWQVQVASLPLLHRRHTTARRQTKRTVAGHGWTSLVLPRQSRKPCGHWCQMASHTGNGSLQMHGWHLSSRARRCVQNTSHNCRCLLSEPHVHISLFRVPILTPRRVGIEPFGTLFASIPLLMTSFTNVRCIVCALFWLTECW